MILHRSFIKDIIRLVITVTFIVINIFLVLRGMIFLGQAADGLIPVSGVFSLVCLALIANMDIILPLMFYIALLMVLRRWYIDHEISVLASCGLSLSYLLKPILILNLIFGSLVVLLSFYIAPLALTKGFMLETEYRQKKEVDGIATGRFVETSNGNGVYFVEKYNKSTEHYDNVFAHSNTSGRDGLVVAESAQRITDKETQDQFLVLYNGTRYEGTAGSASHRIIEFERYALRIDNQQQKKLYLPIRARPNEELMSSSNPQLYGEWIWRIAKVFTLPVLSLFGLAFSYVDTRAGKSSGLIMSFLVYLVYTNLLGYSIALIKKGSVSSSLTVWSIHGLFFLFAVYCFYRRVHNLPLLPQSSDKKSLQTSHA